MRLIATTQVKIGLGLVLVWLLGCRSGPSGSGGGSTVPPGGGTTKPGPDPQGQEGGDGMGEMTGRLQRLVGQERGLRATAAADAAVCEELCELSTAICSVQEKVCELADAHPSDDAYQSLCREARTECREAQESCVACGTANQTRGPEPAPR